jgi:tRNA dimethylallyltransferase
VWEASGKPQSAWFARHGFRPRRYQARLVGVRRERDELDARIRARTERWLASGWIDEVRGLVARGYGEARAMGSVGYRQVKQHLAGQLDEDALETSIVRATRILVRRQRTWLRDQPVAWLQP